MSIATNATQKVRLNIKRQDTPDAKPYYQVFEIDYRAGMNVIAALLEIQRNPVTIAGEKVAPPIWDCNCLEEVCGACTMNINGRVRQSCSALMTDPTVGYDITLEPMAKFPIVRDLMVDRQRLFNTLKKTHAWIDIDGTHDLGPGPTYSEETQEWRYVLSTCMSCGCCLEACPQYTKDNDFQGAAIFGQMELFNSHPTGAFDAEARTDTTMVAGGVMDCGSAQNCFEVCPKHIPLTDAIARLARRATLQSVKQLLTMK